MLTLLLVVLVPALVGGAVLVGLVALAVTRSRAAPAPPIVAPAAGGGVAWVPSTWNAQVLGGGAFGRMGGTLGSTFGTFTLDGGRLGFTADGAVEPAWVVPCPEVWVRRMGVGPFSIAAVLLHGPMGEVRCNVSRERINRITRNSFKDFRESGYADQFVAALHAHGARVL